MTHDHCEPATALLARQASEGVRGPGWLQGCPASVLLEDRCSKRRRTKHDLGLGVATSHRPKQVTRSSSPAVGSGEAGGMGASDTLSPREHQLLLPPRLSSFRSCPHPQRRRVDYGAAHSFLPIHQQTATMGRVPGGQGEGTLTTRGRGRGGSQWGLATAALVTTDIAAPPWSDRRGTAPTGSAGRS